MKYVLDTSVVSALRVRGRIPSVEAWSSAVAVGDQYVTATTIAAIERGVVGKQRSDARQGLILRRWFGDSVLPTFADRVLPFDRAAARVLAAHRVAEDAPFDDARIAAIAQSAQMTVATRTTKRFEPPGVPCLDPRDTGPTVR